MRTVSITLLLLTGYLISFGFVNFDNKQVGENDCKFVEKSMEDIRTIKVGMKRKDLKNLFHQDGGIYGVSEPRFVYEKCEFIKIDVKFEPVDKNQKFPADNPEDTIIKISKPYLEHPFYD